MAAFSDYLEGKIAQFIFKNNTEAFASPGDSLYLALFTAVTGLESNTPSAEVSGGSYARQQVVAANWTQTGGAIENALDIEFAQATAAWGEITHGAIMDAPTGGNVLYWGALTTPREIGNGDQFKVNAGDLDLTHD
jgi:hypothetical protein